MSPLSAPVSIGNQGVYANGYYYLIGDDECDAVGDPAVTVYWSAVN